MSEILPVFLKVILVWFIAATDPETATLWMTDPFVTACVRSSVFAAGAFARDTKTAPPAITPTRARAKIRPGHVIKIPLNTVIDRSPLVDQHLCRDLRTRRMRQTRRDHSAERVGEGAQHSQSTQIWNLPCDIDKGGA